MKCLVCFHGIEAKHPFAFLLKSGFKHCLICIDSEGQWIELDYLSGKPDVRVMAKSDYDMKSHYEDLGLIVVETHQARTPTPWRSFFTWPFITNNCVGLCCSILGVTGIVITPYRLYKKLTTLRKS